jgi:hypothetical protein
VDYLRFKITQAEVQPTMKYEYPQVWKTGVDAVHEKLPTDGPYHDKEM